MDYTLAGKQNIDLYRSKKSILVKNPFYLSYQLSSATVNVIGKQGQEKITEHKSFKRKNILRFNATQQYSKQK